MICSATSPDCEVWQGISSTRYFRKPAAVRQLSSQDNIKSTIRLQVLGHTVSRRLDSVHPHVDVSMLYLASENERQGGLFIFGRSTYE